MTERPILFSAPMVRAILAGTKTQTRRLVTRLRGFGPITEFGPSTTPGYDWHFRDKRMLWHDISTERLFECCPYGKPGEGLWGREAWSVMNRERSTVILCGHHREPEDGLDIVYRATEEHSHRGWRPSIHLPRWASRLPLDVKDIRIQRLQDISEEDAVAEGVTATTEPDSWKVLCKDGRAYDCFVEPDRTPGDEIAAYVKNAPLDILNATAVQNYARLWDAINGAGSWERNPWVWAVSFRRLP